LSQQQPNKVMKPLKKYFTNDTNDPTMDESGQSSLGSIGSRCMTVRTLAESLQKEKTARQKDGIRYRRQLRRLQATSKGGSANSIANSEERSAALSVTKDLSSIVSDLSLAIEQPRDDEDNSRTTRNTGGAESVTAEVIADLNALNAKFSVSFSTVEIREYPIILGENPSVPKGPPLTIDWQHFDEDSFELEEYESSRPDRRRYREMVVPFELRIDCLKRGGASTRDILKRSKEMEKIRIERYETQTMFYRQSSEEKVERIVRGFKNFMSSKKRKERKLIQESQRLARLQQDEADSQAKSDEELLEDYISENASFGSSER
jgi:hypothetical protein